MTWPLQRDCDRFYGNPRGSNGTASAKWEAANLVTAKCPWTLRYAGKPVKGIRIHKKCAASLEAVLKAIWERVGRSQAEIDRIGMSIYGGAYNFRLMRGGSSLSMHSWGCAVDFDPARNGLGNTKPAMDPRVIEEFEREGWEWGGHWSRPDGMHFQASRTKANPDRLSSAATDQSPAKTSTAIAETKDIQRRLKALGYAPGGIDGLWGGNTSGAIAGFLNDIPITPPFAAPVSEDDFRRILPDLEKLLTRAEKLEFKRPVAPERAEATPNELAKKLPEVAKAQEASFWAKVQGWFSVLFGGGVTAGGVASNLLDAKQTVDPIKESFFGGTTSIVVGVAGVAAVVVIAVVLARKAAGSANDAADAATEAFQTGERL